MRNDRSKESYVFAEQEKIRHMLPSRRHHLLVPVRSLKALSPFPSLSPLTAPLFLKTPAASRRLQALADPNQFGRREESPSQLRGPTRPRSCPQTPGSLLPRPESPPGLSPSTQTHHTSPVLLFVARSLYIHLIPMEHSRVIAKTTINLRNDMMHPTRNQ